jgi:hypothetical protein
MQNLYRSQSAFNWFWSTTVHILGADRHKQKTDLGKQNGLKSIYL